ncbi:MAG: sigma-54-dependent Fis family transcriptional regulator [Rickettsiales bacterium TMED254]|nr:AAA family ATPase [Rickettsiales bacterium]RPF75955.1 MAG: sigma-54-dependent Fis family transcriptional regulator [Rickettsiales bacterium TMED254]|tara:strand:+ start:36 stop:1181 length:1146 start_codon:yes stop_codon:yes gene_type:complete
MKEIIIIKDFFENSENLKNFFEGKNHKCSLLKINELTSLNSPKSILIGSGEFENKIKGRENLLKVSRNIGCSKVMILETKSADYRIDSELGGSYLKLFFDSFDESINELLLNMIANQKFSYSDPKTHSLINLVKKVADTEVTVFVHGPTGTGKEVVSNFIHQESKRNGNPFIAVNCAAIPENMLEAMLFGHEKGAFTGASTANKGIFRAADTGTLLLDEISEMPLSLQAKLLRVLQEKKVTPIGSHRDIDVDVRVIATTNRNMINEVKAKKFREDLFYRLNVFPIETTNLCERPGDIIPISMALLKRHIPNGSQIPFLTKETINELKEYSWPGNVRELENVLQRALVLSTNNIVKKEDIMIDDTLHGQTNSHDFLQKVAQR